MELIKNLRFCDAFEYEGGIFVTLKLVDEGVECLDTFRKELVIFPYETVVKLIESWYIVPHYHIQIRTRGADLTKNPKREIIEK